MQAKLVIIAGSTKPQEIRLKLPAILGRGRACSIQLPQPLVSRQHCEVFADGERLRVRDLGSLNGTLVNNERITECELIDGQLLTVGSITFRVAIEVTPTSERPAGSSINKRIASAAPPQTLDNVNEATTNFVPANEFTERAIEPIRTEPIRTEPTPPEPVTLNAKPEIPPAAPVAEVPPSASESNVRADDLLPPSIPGDALPPAAIPPTAIPPAAFPPTAAPFPTSPMPVPTVPPMAMPVALPAATPIAGPLPPGAVPPAALPNVFSTFPPSSAAPPPPATPPVDSSPATDAGDEDLQAFLKSLGKKK